MIQYYEPKIDLTLLGCGFLGCYHVGAILLLTQIWPQKPYNRICGASCGGLVGALLIAGLKLTDVLVHAFAVVRSVRASLASCPIKLACVKKLVEQCLDAHLPHNAHKMCTQKLGLSLTKFYSFENKFVTKFNSRRDLIDAVVAGCYIPLWSGLVAIPKFMGQRFVDGAYSNNMPRFTLTEQDVDANVVQLAVTPFAAQVDVSPPDKWGTVYKIMGTHYHMNWNNFTRTLHAIFPYKSQLYKVYILAGHRDMKNFVLDTNMVKCHQCFVTRTRTRTLQRSSNDDNISHLALIKSSSSTPTPTSSSSSCLLCLKLMEKVDSLTVPQEMLDVLNE